MSRTPKDWISSLAFSAMTNNVPSIQMRLVRANWEEVKAMIDHRDSYGWTVLMWAAHHGNKKLAKALIDNGADVNATSRKYLNDPAWSSLIIAARNGQADLCRLLLDYNADIDFKSRDGESALFSATCFGHLDCVKTLIQAKADFSSLWVKSRHFVEGMAQTRHALEYKEADTSIKVKQYLAAHVIQDFLDQIEEYEELVPIVVVDTIVAYLYQ